MPTTDALREAFPHLNMLPDDMLADPFLHLGVISSYLPEHARLRLSLEVLGEALRGGAQTEKVAA